jgi:hypothetical protein
VLSLCALPAVTGGDAIAAPRGAASMDGAALAFLAPTMALGFLLSPYLDLTFHRALRRSASPHTFAVFGAAFFIIILLSALIWTRFEPGALPRLIVAHLLAQSIFTVTVHLRELRLSPAIRGRGMKTGLAAATVAGAALASASFAAEDPLAEAESTYLRFLVPWGLVFPAYVLLFMPPPRRPTRLRLLVFALLVIGAVPFYEYGFIHGRTWMLVIPLAAMALVAVVFHWKRIV